MNRRWFLLGLAATLAVAGVPAEARMHAPYRAHRILPGGAAPLDAFTVPAGAYSFRRLKSTYAGPAVRIRRASDNLELDIGFTAAGSWDAVAATTHCAATNCFFRTIYDQSGNARDLGQVTAANQLALVFNCDGSLPCWQDTTSTQSAVSASAITPATGIATISVVANRASGVVCTFLRENGPGNRLTANSVASQWTVQPTGIVMAAADGVWHAGIGITHPTAGQSLINIDGVETAGTTIPTTAAGAIGIIGGATTTCSAGEAVFWDNYVLTSTERAALIANQRSFWGTP